MGQKIWIFYRAVHMYSYISLQKHTDSIWSYPSQQILASIRYLNSIIKNLCSFHSEKWKLIVALMGISLVTSEAEHFLIWLLSICNLSFVDFLFIPSPLPPSLSPSLPQTSSKTVLSIYLPDPVPEAWWTWIRKTQSRTQHTWGDAHTLWQNTSAQPMTVAVRKPCVFFFNYSKIHIT